jgi:polygalacturonase
MILRCFSRACWLGRLPLLGLLLLANFARADIALPLINTNNVITVTNAPYNAVADGVTDNAVAISNAVVAASRGGKTNGLFGGTVRLPPTGVFLSGPFPLANNVNLQLDAGAVLRMLPLSQYPGGSVSPPAWLTGSSLTNIEISGQGAIDGQGAAWWPGYKTNSRPTAIVLSKCSVVLLQDFTISNTPAQNISIKGNSAGNITIQNLTIQAPDSAIGVPPSHNTDGIDLAETNCLIENCNISVGDDNVAMGSSSGLSRDITITNCTFGYGHGVSIGSFTFSGVSNITVIDCTFNQTQNGIRLKSDNDTKRGGFTRNLSYLNLGMTNVNFPIHILSYYNEFSTPSFITPFIAATQTVAAVTTNTPIWRDITFSNITATAVSGYPAILVWGRTELPATNIFFDHVNISASEPVELYNANNVQFKNCQFSLPSGVSTFSLFDGQMTVTNSAPPAGLIAFDGLTTNGYGNSIALFNANGWLANTNVLDDGPLTLSGSTLNVSNNLVLVPSTVLNYFLGSNSATVSVSSNLALGGTINVSSGPGFGGGTYTLLTYGRSLSGALPALGSTPSGYNYSFDTNSPAAVKLLVVAPTPPAPTNLTATASNLLINLRWSAVAGATSYDLKRGIADGGPYPTVVAGLLSTNFADANVTNEVTYYYVVTAVAGGESTNSVQASATPLPSLAPINLSAQVINAQLQLSWPQDHLGWRLESQTNSPGLGLGTNWFTLPNSQQTNQIFIPLDPANGSVFLRLAYP